MKIDADSAQVRFPPPLVYLGFLLIGPLTERVLPLRTFGLDRAVTLAAGALLFLAGAALVMAAVGLFKRAGTRPEPWTTSTSIVSDGVYRWTRNPMYLGMALIHAGLAFAMDSPVALLLLPAALLVIRTQVIAREERYLEAKFGEAYLAYKARVRRWI